MLKEKLKNSKGITLIALIITVIVMLILVAVTVSIALNGGIFDQARTATKSTEKNAIYDQIVGAMVLKKDGKIDTNATYDAVESVLESEGKTVSDLKEDGTFTVTGSRGTYTYTITETQIAQGESTDTPVTPDSPTNPVVPEVEVDLTGEYYHEDYNTVAIRITKDGDKYLYTSTEDDVSNAEMAIDKANKTFSISYQYEDSSSHKIVTYEETYAYDLIEENGEVVNKVLVIDKSSDKYEFTNIFWQNTNGLGVGPTDDIIVEGEYRSGGTTSQLRFVFNPDNKTVAKEITYDSGATWNYYYCDGPLPYFWYKGECYTQGDASLDFSVDTVTYNSFRRDGSLFTKISTN